MTGAFSQRSIGKFDLAPEVGFEPTTNRLTADRSTTELLWIILAAAGAYICPHPMPRQVVLLPPKKKPLRTAATTTRKLVAGAGFEPAVRQLPDYEHPRFKPVIE